jgi:signal transduction histidine kinase
VRVTSLIRWPSRWWPQKIRARLTLLYAVLFLAAGSVLLGLTYGLVASRLPATTSISKLTSAQQAKLLNACKKAQPSAKSDVSGKTQGLHVNGACAKLASDAANAATASQRDQTLNTLLLFSLIGLGLMAVASGGLGWIVSGRVLGPVRIITETARRASEEHLGERLSLEGPKDELKELADTFDDMLERLDTAFASQRRFVANASHELRTPLTMMRTAIDVTLAKRSRTPEQLEAMAEKVRRSIDRADNMIDGMLTLAISDQGPSIREPVDLATAVEDALDANASAIAKLDLHTEVELEPAETIGDRFLLDRMVANLIDNAVGHNNPGGWIHVRTGTTEANSFIEVANSGPFVPENAIPSLLEPFGRLEARVNPQEGVGLGLSIVDSIASAHGASVHLRSKSNGGLDVRVVLPSRRDGLAITDASGA